MDILMYKGTMYNVQRDAPQGFLLFSSKKFPNACIYQKIVVNLHRIYDKPLFSRSLT